MLIWWIIGIFASLGVLFVLYCACAINSDEE
jgi:hypothetical protein